MRPHVKALRKKFESRLQAGLLKVANQCAKCGVTEGECGRPLQLHHVRSLSSLEPDDSYDPNVQDNLVTLCHQCHQAYHKCYEKQTDDDFNHFLHKVPLEEAWEQYRLNREAVHERRRREIAKHHRKNK